MDAFVIEAGEDLQAYESLHKAAKLLGFLSDSMETKTFNESSLAYWQRVGERHLKSKAF
ncbi:MAG: hypothetical protein HON43_00460 [Alphaproteobacteria bacterium]|jgi:hypothetical protein|nr:hypothetical protein [Alphaproteobacteria bacterium]MBT5390537.1 hypothetical protein [Alphaproteobacteria bacterium]